ncbi:MAG TPA: methylenetetrahydrofolate reductase [Xanthobacteraceae bacterium]|nr:methylenetetrahydrofolate reductase [Xanthobacteraceae bacterium]
MNDHSRSLPLAPTLQDRLRQDGPHRRFAMTAEIAPPVAFDGQELLRKAMALKGLADAVNVTDGAGARAHMAALAAASLLLGAGIEPVLQLTCRDKNRIALQSELMGAAALGIKNLLILTGDDPKAGDQPDTKPVFDIDSKTLMETARRLRDDGTLPTGRKVEGHADFFIGAADMPIDPPAGWQPSGLLAKVQAGAQFAQTQFCMDAAIVRRYVGVLEAAGITKRLAILIGVNPLRSAKSAAWMKSHLFGTIIPDAYIERLEKAADPSREGIAICVELIEELSTISGVAGVHIMAPGNDAAIPEAIKQARARVKSVA